MTAEPSPPRLYRCTHCGWSGHTPARARIEITGGKYAVDTVYTSICPACTWFSTTIRKVPTPAPASIPN
jgi:hypothetical protein